ncbi:MAG: LacI family DNA-binding transcriptional regulator [Hyphomicrobiales bacterium]
MGSHRFLVKEVALQAGVSAATVDRVLNHRPNVKYQTKQRVLRAVAELERLQNSLNLPGERFLIDVVVEAPDRFAQVVRSAVEDGASGFLPTVFRPRFHMREAWNDVELVARLKRISHGGTKGILLKARDLPEVRVSIAEILKRNIPCATLVTDMPGSDRIAYAGMDNVQAGQTAAYLMSKFLNREAGVVLAISSHDDFRGEDERIRSFQQAVIKEGSGLTCRHISGGYGLNKGTYQQVRRLLDDGIKIAGIYSSSGGNRAIISAFNDRLLPLPIVIGHDLDEENVELLLERKLEAVIVHELKQDIRFAFSKLLEFHKPNISIEATLYSNVQVITPVNMPISVQTL